MTFIQGLADIGEQVRCGNCHVQFNLSISDPCPFCRRCRLEAYKCCSCGEWGFDFLHDQGSDRVFCQGCAPDAEGVWFD